MPVNNSFYSVMPAVHNIIVTNWEEHVNKPAALMCAWFSFDESVRGFDAADLTAAKHWFIDYAVVYVQQYHLAPGWQEERIKGKLNELWGHFTGRAVNSPFAALDELVEGIRKNQIIENARTVDGKTISHWYPVTVWRNLESETPLLAHPAIDLLCVAGSEAAVERSFSAQDALHSKKRNRLVDSTVQNEMFIRFNDDPVHGRRPGGEYRVMGGTCVELTVDYIEKASQQGSVKALFRAMKFTEEEKEVGQEAEVVATTEEPPSPSPSEESKGDNEDHASDADGVSFEEIESKEEIESDEEIGSDKCGKI